MLQTALSLTIVAGASFYLISRKFLPKSRLKARAVAAKGDSCCSGGTSCPVKK